MANKMTRRAFLKRSIAAIFTTALVGGGGYHYARNIEPELLAITKFNFFHHDLPAGFHNFKIVQFSDTHLGFNFELEQLNEIIEKINQNKPDLILFTGDLMDAPNECKEAEKIIPLLSNLTAPYGKFAVYGNHDHGGYGSRLYKEIMENSGFELLINNAREIKLINNERIYIVGIDDAMLGNPNLEQALTDVPENSFKLLLSHAPDLADEAANYKIQLQLSGHSHGGQIKLPFFGALVKPPYAKKYYEGHYTVGENSNLALYVNRGIGTTRLPMRFLCRPEITVITLYQDS